MKLYYIPFLMFGLAACQGNPKNEAKTENQRIITIGGTVTEIVHALGKGSAIIATDKTSTYPAEMQSLPSIGYRTSIKAEGIISLNPTLVLIEKGYLGEEVVTQLEGTGITVKTFEPSYSIDSTKSLINGVATYLGRKAKGDSLITLLEQDLTDLNALLQGKTSQPSILFIYARGPETVSVAGKGTFAHTMIPLAGAVPAIADAEGFKPLTTEALVSANPDYVLIFESGLQSLGGVEGVLKINGMDLTNAGKNKNVIAMDGLYLSGFGPRAVKAAIELATRTHPSAQQEEDTL